MFFDVAIFGTKNSFARDGSWVPLSYIDETFYKKGTAFFTLPTSWAHDQSALLASVNQWFGEIIE